MKKHIPWVEKYRPTKLSDVVLDSTNKKILDNIIKTNYFPNLLFYGPPGTGKTTTIINLIDKYQETYHQKRKELKIHLNASDDRGIDIIRNQLNQFVNTKSFFKSGIKFIILDEVDYMTKNAQQALRYLIQQYPDNIRFCLICNYISRIDDSLQNEFIRLRFSSLPQQDIFHFLKNIKKKESLKISEKQLNSIKTFFKSDIRSMVNFLQSNQTLFSEKDNKLAIISDSICKEAIQKIKNKKREKQIEIIKKILLVHGFEKKEFIKKLIIYSIEKFTLSKQTLIKLKFLIHNLDVNEDYLLNYFLSVVRNDFIVS
jgi:replication factor C subunit 3/5